MPLKEWESIIQQIVDEWNREPKVSGKHRVLIRWRAKLDKEPPHLPPQKIDEIVREVRRRFESSGR